MIGAWIGFFRVEFPDSRRHHWAFVAISTILMLAECSGRFVDVLVRLVW